MRPKTDFFFVHASLKIVLALVSLAAGDGKKHTFPSNKNSQKHFIKEKNFKPSYKKWIIMPTAFNGGSTKSSYEKIVHR